MRKNKLYTVNKHNANLFLNGGLYGIDYSQSFLDNTSTFPGVSTGSLGTTTLSGAASGSKSMPNYGAAIVLTIGAAGSMYNTISNDNSILNKNYKNVKARNEAIGNLLVSSSDTASFLSDVSNLLHTKGANKKDLMRGIDNTKSTLSLAGAGAGAGAAIGSLFGPGLGTLIGAGAGALFGGLTSWISGSARKRRAARRAVETLKAADKDERRLVASTGNSANNVMDTLFYNVLANSKAYGGPIGGALDYSLASDALAARNKKNTMSNDNRIVAMPNSFGMLEMLPLYTFADGGFFGNELPIVILANDEDNMFKNGGGIHIKKKNRGKFTATKKRTGKTTEELTHSKNPLTRKRAIFALNARKWKHSDGGYLEGNTYDIDESEIQRLIDAGYLIEYL